MLRTVLGIAAGIVSAVITIAIVETVGHMIFPPPAGTDVSNPAAMREIMHTIPLGAKIAVLMAWAIGVFVGGVVGILVSRKAWAPWLLAGVVLVFAGITLLMIPHPLWMVAFTPLATAIPAFLAIKLFGSKV